MRLISSALLSLASIVGTQAFAGTACVSVPDFGGDPHGLVEVAQLNFTNEEKTTATVKIHYFHKVDLFNGVWEAVEARKIAATMNVKFEYTANDNDAAVNAQMLDQKTDELLGRLRLDSATTGSLTVARPGRVVLAFVIECKETATAN